MAATSAREGDQMLQAVASVLRERGVDGWLVGGTVRDRELGRYSPDVDVVVAGDTAGIARRVARLLGLPWFTLSEEHQAHRVVGEHAHVDLAAARGGSILADLAQRDFTINAMAMPVAAAAGGTAWPPGENRATGDNRAAEGLIDPFGGLDDLRAGRLRAVSTHIFEDDALRLMRAARFAHTLRLSLEPSLARTVKEHAPGLWQAAPERIANEMVLTLSPPLVMTDAVDLWKELELLPVLFPDVVTAAAPYYSVLCGLEHILSHLPLHFPDAAPLLQKRMNQPVDGAVDRRVALGLTALLWGLSPKQAAWAGSRLKLSSALLSLLQTTARMSRHEGHAGLDRPPGSGPGGPDAGDSSAEPGRAAVLFLWAAAPWEPEAILLAAAAAPLLADGIGSDDTASWCLQLESTVELRGARRLMTAWAQRATAGVPRLPFDGLDLMEELKLSPGPRLGKALRAARLAWEAGEVTTVGQAVEVARRALEG